MLEVAFNNTPLFVQNPHLTLNVLHWRIAAWAAEMAASRREHRAFGHKVQADSSKKLDVTYKLHPATTQLASARMLELYCFSAESQRNWRQRSYW